MPVWWSAYRLTPQLISTPSNGCLHSEQRCTALARWRRVVGKTTNQVGLLAWPSLAPAGCKHGPAADRPGAALDLEQFLLMFVQIKYREGS